MDKVISIKGARENNLKNISVDIPRDKMVVFTGVSGSGKTTLAFNTIFAEGQRRYMESLSSYARQFLGQMQKPDVDSIDGLSPAISIDQKTTNNNPRSTVGTVTEIYDYLRLLYARVGIPHCPNCGSIVEKQTIDNIVDKILNMGESKKIIIKAPTIKGEKGTHQKELASYKKLGYVRVQINGSVYSLDEEITLDKNLKHTISVVVDRVVVKKDEQKRIAEAVEKAVYLANGLVLIETEGSEDILFNTKLTCKNCSASLPEINPRFFSFNSPFGACPECLGLGFKNEIDETLLVRHPEKSLINGAITVFGWSSESSLYAEVYYKALADKFKFNINTPFKDLPKQIQNVVLYGTKEKIRIKYDNGRGLTRNVDSEFEGVIPNLYRRFKETTSEWSKEEIFRYMTQVECSSCHGKRLSKEALSVKVGGLSITELTELSVKEHKELLEKVKLVGEHKQIAGPILKEILARLNFLVDVGLDYLTLSRAASTLSGGEAQRIRLATQIGSGLTGVLYILDEPSIGLHQRDNDKLLTTLKNLRDLGNTLIVVEHDEDTIREADYVIDIGRKAGIHGGDVVAIGSCKDIENCEKSLTGDYLSGRRKIETPTKRLTPKSFLKLTGCSENNLKNLTVDFPVGVLAAVTGVSGSGKSSLVNETLYPVLANRLNRASLKEGKFKKVDGLESLDKVIDIDQTPIGRTPRSNPATYTNLWGHIRDLFAATPEAKERGFAAGRFSFNVSGGRCEACNGDGVKKIEMFFLPDVYVECEECRGTRYNRETLEVQYKGKNIAEVLNMTAEEALKFFENIPKIKQVLTAICDVGLGYIKLGQSSTTLSGGEAQRVKLATELCKRATGKTMYILDEPTTGLHFYDVHKLINILKRLVADGNSVIVIEHNLDVIKTADYIIDLGKEGGNGGGEIVCTGTPETVAACTESYTGKFLKKVLEREL